MSPRHVNLCRALYIAGWRPVRIANLLSLRVPEVERVVEHCTQRPRRMRAASIRGPLPVDLFMVRNGAAR